MPLGKSCVECNVELRVKENGVLAVSMDNQDFPCEIYIADMWQCPNCLRRSILGIGVRPIVVGVEECKKRLEENAARDKPETVTRVWLNYKEKFEAERIRGLRQVAKLDQSEASNAGNQ